MISVKCYSWYFRGEDKQDQNAEGENWDDDCYSETEMSAHYYTLNLPDDHITVIDTKEKYQACLSTLTKVCTLRNQSKV